VFWEDLRNTGAAEQSLGIDIMVEAKVATRIIPARTRQNHQKNFSSIDPHNIVMQRARGAM
jgi:hypothetical protein